MQPGDVLASGMGGGDFSDQAAKAFAVSVDDIRTQGYDLSINRYRQRIHINEQHDKPKDILVRIKAIEVEIQRELEELENLLE